MTRPWTRRKFVKSLASGLLLPAGVGAGVVGMSGSRLFTGSSDPTSLPLIQESDISYLGSFSLPTQAGGSGDSWTMNYGGVGMGMGAGNTIYIGGHLNVGQRIARFNIPSIGGTATVAQNLASVPGTFSNTEECYGGTLLWNDRLTITRFGKYENDGGFTASHTSCDPDFTDFTTPQATAQGRWGAGYLGIVPEEWRPYFGDYPCFGGSGPRSINDNSVSHGPSLYFFDPASVDGSGTIPSTDALFYPTAQTTRIQAGSEFYESNGVVGAAWVPGTRTILFWGHVGAGSPEYMQPVSGDACRNGLSGFSDYPYRPAIWAYDALDLIDPFNGSANTYAPLPYSSGGAYRSWPMPGFTSTGCTAFGIFNTQSACFDPATNRVYGCFDYGEDPEVHVWQIAA